MTNETEPAPCAICGGEWSLLAVANDQRLYCRECGDSRGGVLLPGWEAAFMAWNRAQRRIREERTWQLVVALAPAAFPDLRLGGEHKGPGGSCMAGRWRRVWEAARAGVEAPE